MKHSAVRGKLTDTVLNRSKAPWVVPVIVALATSAAFFPALGNEFVRWDDDKNLLDNPHYRGLGWSQLRWMFSTFLMGHYQPLSWVTFGFDYLLWGMNPFGYHLTNLILHAANAVLFYFIARRLLSAALFVPEGEKPWQLGFSAGGAALLFAIHPLRVESVAWVTERRDVLSGFFYLATLYCYLRAACRPPASGQRWWLGAALVGYTLSLLSKGTAMTLPAVLLLLDIYPLGRLKTRLWNGFKPEFRVVLTEKLPFVVLAGVFAIIALFAQHTGEALKSLQQYNLISRSMQIFYGLTFYLWKTLLPTGLSPIYELPIDFEPWAGAFLLSAVSTVLISLVLYFLRQRWPAALASWVYYIILLAPVSGIAQSGPQLVADRYSYLACLSWPLLLGGWFFRSWPAPENNRTQQLPLIAASIALGLSLITMSLLTWSQNQVWRNTQTLWQHAIAVTPYSSIAYYNLGRTFETKNDMDEAVESYRRALSINPEYAKAHINLAGLLARKGIETEAIAHYRRALEIRPDNAGARNNLGVLLEMQGDVEAALAEFQKALHIDPNFDKAFFNLGKLFARKGDLAKAARHYEQAVRLNPNEVDFQIGLAIVLARQGQLESATSHLVRAVKLRPDDADAHVLLARSLAAQGKKDEAERHYQQALRLMKSQNQTPPSH
ncbi:MAG TPA: tetratricopeptide repeat protein [Candidatus Binatia bacterium]|nr:tetratricopeptide repeat protein [Candidatus Binatia bacterium]